MTIRRLPSLLVPVAIALGAAAANLPAAPAVEILFEQDGHARIPFQLRNQLVWIRGQVNGADSVWIVVDTGAEAGLIAETVARRMSLKFSGKTESRGAGGSQPGAFVQNVTISIPGLSLRHKRLPTTDMSAFGQQGGRPMDVVLGYDLFQSRVVRFDYSAGVMDVWDAEKAPPPHGSGVPFTLVHNHPYVDAELVLPGRTPLKGRFVIDTGSAMAVLVAPEVAAKESVTTAFSRSITTIGRGIGGELKNQVGRAESFSLGNLVFKAPTVTVPELGGRISVPGSIGNIGGQILGRCRVTFDYAKNQVYFEPGNDFDRPFEADMLGATLQRAERGATVRWVNPGTPAAEAGLLVGDVVTHVDGEPTASIDPAALRMRMQEAGRQVKLRITRGTLTIEATAKLRRLI